jgi:hypothetical protein
MRTPQLLVGCSLVVLSSFASAARAGEIRTYQFVAEDRPFHYSVDVVNWATMVTGTFDLDLDFAQKSARLTRLDVQLVDPLWNGISYKPSEFDDVPLDSVWPNKLTKVVGKIVDAFDPNIIGVHLLRTDDEPYVTLLQVKLDGHLAHLYAQTIPLFYDGPDYSLLNAVAIQIAPEPGSGLLAFVAILCGTSLVLGRGHRCLA